MDGARPWENELVFVTNHVLSGVLIGQVLERSPASAFVAGVASHLVLDALPHWGCAQPLESEQFLTVARRDGVLGLIAMAGGALLVQGGARKATVAAMVGAVLLDLDKPMDHFLGRNPFPAAVQRLHGRIQNESPERLPHEVAYGIALALADMCWGSRLRRRWAAN
jgi:hypothetical protein